MTVVFSRKLNFHFPQIAYLFFEKLFLTFTKEKKSCQANSKVHGHKTDFGMIINPHTSSVFLRIFYFPFPIFPESGDHHASYHNKDCSLSKDRNKDTNAAS